MKKVLFCLLLACSMMAKGQVYNNEWIDYNKTYYKFKIRNSGLYRIPQTVLAAVGLGNTPAEQFQLWRDGAQVPVYTSVASGILGVNDYIEFWGEKNNGKADKGLYRKPEYQLNDNNSLISDTAYYFLTVNLSGNNQRLVSTTNEAPDNTLSPEPYFLHKIGYNPVTKINGGLAYDVGQFLYSSSYDKGEGWSSADVSPGSPNSNTFNNLFVYSPGPEARFKIAVSGNTNDIRNYKVVVNTDSVLGKNFSFFDYTIDSTTFPLSLISSGTASINIYNTAGRMVVHKYELTYPRTFNFGAAKNFEFNLPSSNTKRFLQISNFTFGSVAPVLYDITNGRRYVGDISAKPLVKFVIQPSAEARYILVNEETTNTTNVTALQPRKFVNFSDPANQSDFVIISNPILFDGPNGSNPVEEYRAYRSSTIGGGYNAKVYLVEELTDQFAFGIKKHPVGLRNFILFARNKFAVAPKHVLLLGKGVLYTTQRGSENNADINKLNLVPTFGSPASDVLFTAEPGSSVGKVSIGRISAINAQEVSDYLSKVKEFEAAQALPSPDVNDKLWMKNVLHIVGVSEPVLQATLENSMTGLKSIISDTLYGARVSTLTKQTGNSIEQVNSEILQNLFSEGLSLITYFGHSAASTLSFNLDNPENYNNKGKYPLFIAMGCNVGDIFGYTIIRYSSKQTISENYVLAPGKGTIGFIASTHFGIVNYLDNWSEHVYTAITKTDYGKSIGEVLNIAASRIADEISEENFYARCNIEQTGYHGDPSIKLNTHAKPDYVVNDQLVTVSPSFVSISESSFKIKVKFVNLGKAINKQLSIEVKREYPDQTSEVVYKDTLSNLIYTDSLSLDLPIDPQRDKGSNKITITIDADNGIDELFENNNSVTKDVFIYQDEVRPIYPYNFAIVNDPNVILSASTADPFSQLRDYKFEVDTTELFNSPLKVTKTLSSTGGVLEFKPGLTFKDSTVYYWRIGMASSSNEYHWNMSSFIFLRDGKPGFNQSHLYQHLKSEGTNLHLDTAGKWEFGKESHNLFIKNTVFPTGSSLESDFIVAVDDDDIIRSACVGYSLIFNVFDSKTFLPWKNVDANGSNLYLYGSASANCAGGRQNNFEFSYMDVQNRKRMIDFMNAIPSGAFVVVRNIPGTNQNQNTYANDWRKDTTVFGSGISLYHKLKEAGFNTLDSFYKPRAWIFVYQKNSDSFVPKQTMTNGIYDMVTVSVNCLVPEDKGSLTSPSFGPAKTWNSLVWEGKNDSPADNINLNIIGINRNGVNETIKKVDLASTQGKIDISSIQATEYPYIKLQLENKDTSKRTPYQLDYWRLMYEPVPEGAIGPNLFFNMKDTLEAGEFIDFKIAYKNVSATPFDSLKVRVSIIDANNVKHELPDIKYQMLNANDTILIRIPVDSKQYVGTNTLFVEVNPDNIQLEEFSFNNFIYYKFYIHKDEYNPLLDVTFDNVHILNGDIVSAKPGIVINMKDGSSKLLLNDSSLLVVKVRYPDNTIRTFKSDTDTLRFIPATQGSDNTATINFKPYFIEDGTYELMVSGVDKSGNKAGNADYRISFQVINKPMISNMLNYPNPFTTSTAFVFTLTGSEIPENIKIQILTITGKIVREITNQELGPIRIGRNITEYKWDGSDQFGQKLANGVYLYRVITNLNGKSLDKYRAEGENTDKYFNKGYGKMYLMR